MEELSIRYSDPFIGDGGKAAYKAEFEQLRTQFESSVSSEFNGVRLFSQNESGVIDNKNFYRETPVSDVAENTEEKKVHLVP